MIATLMPRFSKVLWRLPGAAVVLLVACLGAEAQEVTATASFNPPQIGAGQIGTYVVELSGIHSAPNFSPPSVPGLAMPSQPSGRSTQMSIINGEMSASISLQFQVQPAQTGSYTVPAYTITANGKQVSVPAATLAVTERPPTAPDLLTLTVSTPRKEVYVGERLPLDLTLNWRADVHPDLSGCLTLDNDNFESVHLSGNPDQTSTIIDGQRYGTATFHTFITPLKSGPQTVHFTQPLVVTMPGQNNDFVGNGMGGFVFSRQEQVNLQSPGIDLNVVSLPMDGRPANFTGAIGTFSVQEPSLSSADLQVGVPVTLTLNVSGQGNFDRLRAPTLNLGSSWRTYPPKDSFKAQDPSGYHGDKTFDYVVMPMSDQTSELSGLEFNFFNPETKSYVELPLKAIPVTVKPAAPGQSVPLPAIASSPTEPTKPQLIGLHTEAGSWQPPQPRLMLTSVYFWAAQAIPAAVFASFVMVRRRKLRLEDDPVYARRLRARQQATHAAAKARASAAKGSAAEFYEDAQRALQEAATADRLDTATALTWQEFDAHLAANGVDLATRQQAQEIFDAGDALRFGGFAPNEKDLAAAANRLDNLVQQLLGRV